MIAEIIRVKNGKFVPTTNALGVPEFMDLYENTAIPEVYFLYIHYYFFPTSAYAELPEDEKEKQLMRDFPVDLENPFMVLAMEKAAKLYDTPLKRGFLAAKKAYDLLSITMNTLDNITLGKDGSYGDVDKYLANAHKRMQSYLSVEKEYKSEVSSYGSRELSFDDDIDYSKDIINLDL